MTRKVSKSHKKDRAGGQGRHSENGEKRRKDQTETSKPYGGREHSHVIGLM